MTSTPRQRMEAALPCWPRLHAFARRLTGDAGRADELAQEALLRFASAAREPDLHRPLLPLLSTIARHVLADERRRRVPQTSADDLDPPDLAADDPAAAPLHAERRQALHDALAGLSPLARAVVLMADGLSLSRGEIAAALDRSPEVVRVTLHRARRRLRGTRDPRLSERSTP